MHPALRPNDYHQPLNSPLTGALTFSSTASKKVRQTPLDFALAPKPRSAAPISQDFGNGF